MDVSEAIRTRISVRSYTDEPVDSATRNAILDAGRAITHMQFRAWERGIGSCICTNFDDGALHAHLDVPADLAITAIVGFGYPPFDVEELRGRKDRNPLEEIVFRGRFGSPFERGE